MGKIKYLFFIFFLALIISCGEDGQDGESFLALSWVSINSIGGFSHLPDTIYNGEYYSHPEGSDSGWYVSFDDSYWTVYYTITVNEGELAQGFQDGLDGENIYYEIALYSTGPIQYEWDYPYAPSLEKKDISLPNTKSEVDLNQYDMDNPEVFNVTKTNDTLEFNIIYKRYKKK